MLTLGLPLTQHGFPAALFRVGVFPPSVSGSGCREPACRRADAVRAELALQLLHCPGPRRSPLWSLWLPSCCACPAISVAVLSVFPVSCRLCCWRQQSPGVHLWLCRRWGTRHCHCSRCTWALCPASCSVELCHIGRVDPRHLVTQFVVLLQCWGVLPR